MASIDNLKLHDIAVRNAVLLESLKKYEISKRDKVFRQLRKELDTVIGKVQYEDLGLMTKKEVAKLLRELKAAHAGFYDVVGDGLVKTVQDFSGGKLVASKSLWANVSLDINSEEDAQQLDLKTYNLTNLEEDESIIESQNISDDLTESEEEESCEDK